MTPVSFNKAEICSNCKRKISQRSVYHFYFPAIKCVFCSPLNAQSDTGATFSYFRVRPRESCRLDFDFASVAAYS
jgi:hypothetical protein